MGNNKIENSTNKITKKDVTKSMWIYYAGAELSNSYERLQSLVFCASMTPILKKLYKTDEELSAALKRHLVFFNTEGIIGAVIQGITISMEEQKAKGEDITDDAITGIKTGLMGPLAGIGDAIIWAALMPILISIFLPFASNGSAMGGIMPLILYPLITILISYYLIHNGYTLGKKSVVSMLHGGKMKQIIFTANVIGLIMMGALSASYVTISTPLVFQFTSGTQIVIQDILDSVVIGILPLTAVFVIYTYLKKKGPNYNRILLSVVVFSIICSLLGIL
ncbi:PTS system mannose/fructose/sorbose family transporter subunit IID [Anaerocolumna aminovalerica]|jgi:D-glucosaminate-specific PTS system IID component|uniref:PTS system IID component, Man family n=1 Tax=Anaerocolumna aminovalerica TaxID=1527 RepID=A0A1I5IIG8_9FIRM|nr:PTS system mannose/fructose/sorbose family transporter subunit IID [Anaerocolumna aminovalerica]MBU5334222.1 PTS system mannose/fructose/sorbose family transporter subunit IID [Anaerocolumna aminovalerica]MDU6266619.1 PTS system mannose/fructose/sorbose family transporter subunit IID [Anaerocolumna aminovalerica]SFO60428.1 PTS system IID component, Man family [Anaerocolumna aminovalerica]